MIRLNKLSVGECGTVPENIVVSFHIEDVFKLSSYLASLFSILSWIMNVIKENGKDRYS
jgi:hypothetical protein